MEHKNFNLIEHLASNIYEVVQDYLTKGNQSIGALKITVHKMAPPVPNVHGGVHFTYGGKGEQA